MVRISQKTLRDVEDLEVTITEPSGDEFGDMHAVGVTTDGGIVNKEDFPPGVALGALTSSIAVYGGSEALGKPGKSQVHKFGDRLLVTVGLGKTDDWAEGLANRGADSRPDTDLLERARAAAGQAFLAAHGLGREGSLSMGRLYIPGVMGEADLLAAQTGAMVVVGGQSPRRVAPTSEGDTKISRLIFSANGWKPHEAAFDEAVSVAQANNLARLVFETPHESMGPNRILEEITAVVGEYDSLRFDGKVLQKKDIMKHAQNHPLSPMAHVAAASPEAVVAVVEYKGDPSSKEFVAMHGKGVTFDSGGYDVKSVMMEDMNGDKGGAATMLGLMQALAAENVPINMRFYFMMTPNLINEDGNLPGQVIYTSGISDPNRLGIYVKNTDAEGRLAMLSGYLMSRRRKDVILETDIATLTGAQLVGTGPYSSGVIGNVYDPRVAAFMNAVTAAGEHHRQRFTPHYADPDASKNVEGPYPGTISNAGKARWGGNLDAYWLFKAAARDRPVVHLDIAPILMKVDRPYLGPDQRFGMTPVRTLFHAVKNYAMQRKAERKG